MQVLLKLLKNPAMRKVAVTALIALVREIVNSPDAEAQVNALIDEFTKA